jgi:hypothetical protein
MASAAAARDGVCGIGHRGVVRRGSVADRARCSVCRRSRIEGHHINLHRGSVPDRCVFCRIEGYRGVDEALSAVSVRVANFAGIGGRWCVPE